jgi:hypothetical protein
MARKDCEDCKGTGLIETEGVVLGRSYYDKEVGGLVIPSQGDGKWKMTQCPCVGEKND